MYHLDYGGEGARSDAAWLEFAALKYRDKNMADPEYQRMILSVKNIVASELLTDRQRDCLLLRYGEGMTGRQIAAAMGVTAPTVSRHLKKARRQVRNVMALSFPRLQGRAAH